MPVTITLANADVRGPTITDSGTFAFDSADFTSHVGVAITPGVTLNPDVILAWGAVGQVEHYNILVTMGVSNSSAENWRLFIRPTYLLLSEAKDPVSVTVAGQGSSDQAFRAYNATHPANEDDVHVLVQGGDEVFDFSGSGGVTLNEQQNHAVQAALTGQGIQLSFENGGVTSIFTIQSIRVWGKYLRIA